MAVSIISPGYCRYCCSSDALQHSPLAEGIPGWTPMRQRQLQRRAVWRASQDLLRGRRHAYRSSGGGAHALHALHVGICLRQRDALT
jgi:hypothetical protein